MTDERSDEPDFDDPAHTGIRDLLAAARLETPIPDEVAARLDATLAELTGRRTEQDEQLEPVSATVIPLRRRLAPRLLAAAAIVAVAGAGAVGLNQVMKNNGGSNDSAGSAVSADSGAKSAPVPAVPENAPGDYLKDADGKNNLALTGGKVPVLTRADFAAQVAALDLKDVRELRITRLTSGTIDSKSYDARPTPTPSTTRSPVEGLAPEPAGAAPGTRAPSNESNLQRSSASLAAKSAALRALRCTGPNLDGTRSYPILVDGQAAVLVVHPVKNGSRFIEAWSCDGTKVLVFTTVPG